MASNCCSRQDFILSGTATRPGGVSGHALAASADSSSARKPLDEMPRVLVFNPLRFGCYLSMKGIMRAFLSAVAASLFVVSGSGPVLAGQASNPPGRADQLTGQAGPPLPAGYTIGSDDVLSVVFWREKDLSTDVVVRPDGLITLPLINDVQAAGLTPEQLRTRLTAAAGKFVTEPNVTVVVKAINSRKVFITGQVVRGGPFPLGGPTTVLQLIATAGGLQEFAKADKIVILRTENGKSTAHPFNYEEVMRGKNLQQNIELKPGDTVLVP